MSDSTERRYSEREFALILRKASELQVDGELPARAEGLSLDEIKQIAREAGIDPELVGRAAALVGYGDIVESHRLLGPASKVHMSSSVEGELGEDDMRRLMEVVRYETGKTGTLHEVLGSVAWKADGQEVPTEVRITPRDGRTTLEVLSRADAYKALIYLLGGTLGILAGVITIPLLGLTSVPVMLAASLVVAPVVATLAVRPLWTWWAKRWRGRLSRLLDTLREEAERRQLEAGDGGDEASPGEPTRDEPVEPD